MPLNAETEAHLRDLEAAGFTEAAAAIRAKANANPALENTANSLIGGGILRRQEFTTYKASVEKEAENLRKQITDLARNQSSLNDFAQGSELYKSALETIQIQRDNLIAAGYDPEEVKKLSMEDEKGLQAALVKAGGTSTTNNGDNKMPTNDNSNGQRYVTEEEFLTTAANVAGGNVISSVQLQFQLDRARKLGVELTEEGVEQFSKNLLKGLREGKNYTQITDETFGLREKIQVKNEADDKARIEARAAELTAEALKKAGVSTTILSTRNGRRGIADTLHNRATSQGDLNIEGEGGTAVVGGIKVPVNKKGHVEFYKLRGNPATRMENAMAEYNRLEQEHPDIFEFD